MPFFENRQAFLNGKLSRTALLAGVLSLLAIIITVSGCTPVTRRPGAADPTVRYAGQASRWLAIAAIAWALAPRRSLTLWIVVSMLVGIELGYDAPGVAMHP